MHVRTLRPRDVHTSSSGEHMFALTIKKNICSFKVVRTNICSFNTQNEHMFALARAYENDFANHFKQYAYFNALKF